MIEIAIAFIFIFILFFFTRKEGFEDEDDMKLILEALLSAKKDSRMTPEQKIALEDALRYADYIKNI